MWDPYILNFRPLFSGFPCSTKKVHVLNISLVQFSRKLLSKKAKIKNKDSQNKNKYAKKPLYFLSICVFPPADVFHPIMNYNTITILICVLPFLLLLLTLLSPMDIAPARLPSMRISRQDYQWSGCFSSGDAPHGRSSCIHRHTNLEVVYKYTNTITRFLSCLFGFCSFLKWEEVSLFCCRWGSLFEII